MTTLPAAVTATSARDRLEDDGLAALGITMPLLAATWSPIGVTFDDDALTLTMPGPVLAPVMAVRSWVDDLVGFGVSGVDGIPFVGTGAIVRLHPQASLRLDRLLRTRLGAVAGDVRPVPTTLVIRNASDDVTAQWFAPGMPLAPSGLVSFHDERGLIIDPVAVAGLFADLLDALPGLGSAPSNAPGGLAQIAGLGTAGTFVHVVDPHGAPFRDVDGVAPQLESGGNPVGAVPPNGLVAVAGGESLGIPASAAERLRLGWSRNDTLDRAALTPPALPGGVTLHRQFLRATAVDLRWHLLGNRSGAEQHGIGPDDQQIPAEFLPQVRDRVRMDCLVDGVDTLGAAGQVLAPPNSGAFTGLMFAVSPTLDAAVGLPPGPGPTGHWPTFPAAPNGTIGTVSTANPAPGLTAAWSGARDVVVTFAAGTLPRGSHVRVFPQVFLAIDAITADQPSFVRGDGAAGLVNDETVDLSLALTNPLGLPAASNQPAGSVLTLDVVVNDRAGDTLFRANLSAPVTAGPTPAVADPFGAPDRLAVVPDNVRSLAPSPVFGLPAPPPPAAGAPTSIVDLLRRLASETTPRIGPRLPTMARFPTLLMVATDDAGTRSWDALVTGARWNRESRCARRTDGNPGGPAGADVSASGVRVDGAAAFDVAQIALRRAQPLLPLVGGGLGWIPFVGDSAWDPPAEPPDDGAPAGQTAPRTSAVAVLRTVAVGVESPELTIPAIPMPAPDASVQNLVDDLAGELGVPPPIVTVAREEEMVREIRREFHWSRFGSRDALWSLRRAVRQARDLVFVASPQFAATALPGAQPMAHEVDLVGELASRMAEHPSLLVAICVPRWPDHATAYAGWVRQSFRARNEAIQTLTDVDADRVVVFHPRGFPGRAAAIRTTTVVVDDAWMLSGTSHWRRRGMTFDEGVDVVGFDRRTDDGGASVRIRNHRRALMADLAGISAGEPEFVRLFGTRTCVDVIADLVGQGGLGRLAPFWPGPSDTDVLEQTDAVADPDGGSSAQYLALFAGLLNESP